MVKGKTYLMEKWKTAEDCNSPPHHMNASFKITKKTEKIKGDINH